MEGKYLVLHASNSCEQALDINPKDTRTLLSWGNMLQGKSLASLKIHIPQDRAASVPFAKQQLGFLMESCKKYETCKNIMSSKNLYAFGSRALLIFRDTSELLTNWAFALLKMYFSIISRASYLC